jgi:uncharacterized protein (UPF0332 family)
LTPEAADYLSQGKISLSDAQAALDAGLYRLAARESYIAALNAARAIIFERRTIASKSHSGTHALLHQMVHEGLAVDRASVEFLSDGFKIKNASDYGPYEPVDAAKAKDAVGRAARLVDRIEALLSE